jgi:hypothetical protein
LVSYVYNTKITQQFRPFGIPRVTIITLANCEPTQNNLGRLSVKLPGILVMAEKMVQNIRVEEISSFVFFRCAIHVVFIYTNEYACLCKSQHNLVFCCFLFKLTTCFGLCFRPFSGHKTCNILGSYTVSVITSEYMELKFNEISLSNRFLCRCTPNGHLYRVTISDVVLIQLIFLMMCIWLPDSSREQK